MLDFADLPYEFVPPKPSGLIIALAQFYNRRFGLPGKNHLVSKVELRGAERFEKARQEEGARFVLLPNHSTHSDPQIMTEVCRRLKVEPAFMAAYDVFARGKINSWIMQRFGAFSVDREGSDRKSMKCAARILDEGEYPLVLFPEGNVYLCNDHVTPFAEGASYIALRAQKALGESAPVYAVPVSIKFTFVEDVREKVLEELDEIAALFKSKLDRDASVTDEIKRISLRALSHFLRQRGYLPSEGDLLADRQIEDAVGQILTSLESKMDLRLGKVEDMTDRVRKIRAAIHSVRTDPEREVDHRAASHWADEAMLALRILGYHGGYTADDPTLDRVTETIARLREDVFSKMVPPDGRRHCMVQLGTPIDLRGHLESFRKRARGTIEEVTAACEKSVQAGIDEMNASNKELGGTPFDRGNA